MSAYDTPSRNTLRPDAPQRATLYFGEAIGNDVPINFSDWRRLDGFNFARSTHMIEADAVEGTFTILRGGDYRVSLALTATVQGSGGTTNFDLAIAFLNAGGADSVPEGSVTPEMFPDCYPIEIPINWTGGSDRIVHGAGEGMYASLDAGDVIAVYMISGGGTVDGANIRPTRGGLIIERMI